MIVLYAFLFHEGLNLWVPVPLFTLVLISADVHISIREKGRHFPQKSIEKLVDLVACGIEGRLKNSGCTFDRIRTRRTAEFRITNQPTCAVQDVKLDGGHRVKVAFKYLHGLIVPTNIYE